MTESTKRYINNIVRNFNKYAEKEAFDEMLIQSYMLCAVLKLLKLEGVGDIKIIHDDPYSMYSAIHLEDEKGGVI